MEFIAGVMLGFGFWPIMATLLIVSFLFEANDSHGFAAFLGLVSLGVAYFFYSVTWQMLLVYAAGYIVAGVLWSAWRYKRYVSKAMAACSRNARDLSYAAERLQPSRMSGAIVTWIIIWPISMIENITGDVVMALKHIVTTQLRALYAGIYNSAMKNVSPDTDS